MNRDPAEQVAMYCRYITRTKLTDLTVKVYQRRARAFGDFLRAGGEQYAEAFTNPDVRDYAVREWRRTLLNDPRNLSSATVNQHMTVVGALCEWTGVGRPTGISVDVPPSGKEGLGEADLRKVMRAAKARGPRDFALVRVFADTGIRIGESAALNVDHVAITDRTGQLDVRYGKGGKPRKPPLSPVTRDALRPWLHERADMPGIDPERGPLWIARNRVDRLSARAMYQVVKNCGKDAGVALHPHTLRHTAARRMIESGVPITDVGTILGHKSTQTTAIYTKATDADLERAVEAGALDL